MQITAFCGSYRKGGNTSILMEAALNAAKKEGAKVEFLYLSDYKFVGCIGCEGCSKNNKCVINDDMQVLYTKLRESDGIILGSPTYFYNVTAIMKAFIDRLYCFESFSEKDRSCWMGEFEGKFKYAVTMGVCEQKDEKYMGYTVDAMSLPIIDLGIRVIEEVRAIHSFYKGEILNNSDQLNKAVYAGKKLVEMILLAEKTVHNSINS
ncbi:MAG: flavodoxin family protein [Eubacteriales bacterium]